MILDVLTQSARRILLFTNLYGYDVVIVATNCSYLLPKRSPVHKNRKMLLAIENPIDLIIKSVNIFWGCETIDKNLYIILKKNIDFYKIQQDI